MFKLWLRDPEGDSSSHSMACMLMVTRSPWARSHCPLSTHTLNNFISGKFQSVIPKTTTRRCTPSMSPQRTLPASILGRAFWADPGLLTTSKGKAQKASLFNPILSCMSLFRKERSKVDKDVLAPLSLQSFSVVSAYE